MIPVFYSHRVVKAQVLCGKVVKNKMGELIPDENLDDFRNYVCDYGNFETQMMKAYNYFNEKKHEIKLNKSDTSNTWVILRTVTDYYDSDNYYIRSDIQEIDSYGA